MPRARSKENRGLPPRWRFYHGAYRFLVPPGQEAAWDGKRQFTLGTTLGAAYKVWAERVGRNERVVTIGEALDRYAREVIPDKRPATRVGDIKRLPTLRRKFGDARLDSLLPKDIYTYVGANKHRLTAAHREVELLSHVFTMCVQWGLIDRHPWKGQVVFQREMKPRPGRRYVEDSEVLEVLSLQPRRPSGSVLMVQAYIRLKLLTGLRQTDLLLLQPALHFVDAGIRIETSKTGVRQVFEWNPELRAAVDMALAARPLDIARWLFCTKQGGCYVNADTEVRTFARIWSNFMQRALAETKLTVRFKERDLRAKVASDAETLERARELLGHADARLTQRVYVRKPALIRPARGV